MKVIGIAGGSGSGKSSVSYALLDSGPGRFEVLHIDDYHRPGDDPGLPRLHGGINWDHPDVMDWQALISDVKRLKSGRPVTMATKAKRPNPDYAVHRRVVRRTVEPKPVLIVEGYLSLHNPDLRKLFDKSFYLDLDDATRLQRRDKQKLIPDPDYDTKVLLPMHAQYVEPSKARADLVIDVAPLSVEQVKQVILDNLD